MVQRTKAVVFDFGGVIAEEGFWQGLRHIASSNGKDPDRFFSLAEELIHREPAYVTGRSDEAEYWRRVREEGGVGGSDEALREIVLSRFVVRPRILEIADALRARGIVTGILSDQTDWLDELDRRSPFFRHFDHVYNSFHIHKSKRDPSVFADLCAKLGLGPDDVLFVDDNAANITRAASQGLATHRFVGLADLEREMEPLLALQPLEERVYDCIVVGAGPGGLQAAIYLGRYNRTVLVIDRGGGRTTHARHIENFLGRHAVSGKDLIACGIEQARRFGAVVLKGQVTKVAKRSLFEVMAGETVYRGKSVIVSTGGRENLPEIENIPRFFGASFFTCVDCDGYHTTGKKLVIIGNSIATVRLAFGMKQMYTDDVTLVLIFFELPEGYAEALEAEGIALVKGRPARIIGNERMEALEMQDGRRVPCEMIMSNFGFKLNKEFLEGLDLKLDGKGFKFVTDHNYESSMKGLFILGPLTGHDQVAIAAGEGATAAIEINKRLLDL